MHNRSINASVRDKMCFVDAKLLDTFFLRCTAKKHSTRGEAERSEAK